MDKNPPGLTPEEMAEQIGQFYPAERKPRFMPMAYRVKGVFSVIPVLNFIVDTSDASIYLGIEWLEWHASIDFWLGFKDEERV